MRTAAEVLRREPLEPVAAPSPRISIRSVQTFFLIAAMFGVGVSYGKLYLFHVALALLFFTYLLVLLMNRSVTLRRLPFPSHRFFYGMTAWYALTIAWSVNRSYALIYLFYLACGIAIMLATISLCTTAARMRELLHRLWLVFVIEITVGIGEAFQLFRWPISPYSPLAPKFGRQASEYLELDTFSLIARVPTGFQWNPNNFAVTLLLVLPFVLYLSRGAVRLFSMVAIVFVILMTGSRGSILGLAALVAAMVWIERGKIASRHVVALVATVGTLAAATAAAAITWIDSAKVLWQRLTGMIATVVRALDLFVTGSPSGEGSLEVRRQLIANGIRALRESEYLGVGGGNSKTVQEAVGTVKGITSMHNFWIELLVEGGALFFLCFACWYGAMVVRVARIARAGDLRGGMAKALFLALVSFLVGAISASTTIYLFPMWLMFGLSVALINTAPECEIPTP